MSEIKEEATRYEVMVLTKEIDTLIDKNTYIVPLKGKLKGGLYSKTICIAEVTEETDWEWGIWFGLTQSSDFEAFSRAMKTIDGVIGVKKMW